MTITGHFFNKFLPCKSRMADLRGFTQIGLVIVLVTD